MQKCIGGKCMNIVKYIQTNVPTDLKAQFIQSYTKWLKEIQGREDDEYNKEELDVLLEQVKIRR
jgi:hypothetical protein